MITAVEALDRVKECAISWRRPITMRVEFESNYAIGGVRVSASDRGERCYVIIPFTDIEEAGESAISACFDKINREMNRLITKRICSDFKYSINSVFGISSRRVPDIKKVIFNNPATIVIWSDNSKTIVKADKEDFDPEKGLAMAITKKALGNRGNYYNELKKYLGDAYETEL